MYIRRLKTFILSFSELGQKLTNSFDKIEDLINQLDWYLLPIRIQNLLPTIIMNEQQPTVIRCFGNILCSRDQFKKVNLIESIINWAVHCAIY